MSDKNRVVILAAGKGTRLKSDLPKPLVQLRSKSLVEYVIKTVEKLGDISIIIGYRGDEVEEHINNTFPENSFEFIVQEEQLGTGHAIMTYFEKSKTAKNFENTFILCADTPLVDPSIFSSLYNELEGGFNAVAATFETSTPKGYGRILRYEKGFTIREEKDANENERKITEVNAAMYVFKTQFLEKQMGSLNTNNKSGEFYLTDSFKEGANVKALLFDEPKRFLGINDLYQLSQADRYLCLNNQKHLLLDIGVQILDPSHTYIYSSNIGAGTIIHPNTSIDEVSVIGENVVIEMGVTIINSIIASGSIIKANSYITDSKIGRNCKVGPMAQLRPGCSLGDNVKVGNFVELKKSSLDTNTSVSHLSYLGDAIVGKDVNIGCGFVTCNYDGANKHITKIGDRAFIGSDCQVVAPIEIGRDAYIGSGSTVNKSVPDEAFAIARARQETKQGLAKKFMKSKPKSS